MSKITYESGGRSYDLITTVEDDRLKVTVVRAGVEMPVSYSVAITDDVDYYMQHKKRLIDHLIEIAKSDVDVRMYDR